MGLRAGGPASRRARFSRQGSDAGHGRVGLLRDRQESSAQFRGNQKRPRAFERRAFLQRSRASGIFDAGMHDPSPDRDSRQSRRPLINTRDEPHVDASRYRRFHVILGDSNMSEWATALKIGTTALVLDLIERGQAPQLEIAQPVDANKSISRDQNYDWIIELKDGRKISAIEVQRIYLRAASKVDIDAPGEDRQWILREWENVLNDLERDVMTTRDRVDWAAKKFLLNAL